MNGNENQFIDSGENSSMRDVHLGGLSILLVACLGLGACTAVPTGGPAAPAGISLPSDGSALVPAGFGTLTQDEFTLTLFVDDLRIKVTPLDESIIRLAAPDTYQRLRDLAAASRPRVLGTAGSEDVDLFLISFFTRSPTISFEPNDLQLLNRGIRFRRMGWDPISPNFGTQRLTQQVPQLAVYGFAPEIDFEIDLVVEYQGVQNAGWSAIISRIREERGRVRARAGG
jgi:hypothetical protein